MAPHPCALLHDTQPSNRLFEAGHQHRRRTDSSNCLSYRLSWFEARASAAHRSRVSDRTSVTLRLETCPAEIEPRQEIRAGRPYHASANPRRTGTIDQFSPAAIENTMNQQRTAVMGGSSAASGRGWLVGRFPTDKHEPIGRARLAARDRFVSPRLDGLAV